MRNPSEAGPKRGTVRTDSVSKPPKPPLPPQPGQRVDTVTARPTKGLDSLKDTLHAVLPETLAGRAVMLWDTLPPASRVYHLPGEEGRMSEALKTQGMMDRAEGSVVPGAVEVDSTRPRLMGWTPSSLLGPKQWELKWFQQLYSQRRFFNLQGQAQEQGFRSSYYTGIFSFVHGGSRRINLGGELWLRGVGIGAPASGPLDGLVSGPDSLRRMAVSAVGPKVKWQPWAQHGGLSLQSALLIPTARDPEGISNGRPYLATSSLLWWTQFYYSRYFGRHWQLFAEVDVYAGIRLGRGQASQLALPVSAYVSRFVGRRLTLQGMVQAWPTIGSVWLQAGLGGKYRLGEGLEVEALYGRFLAGVAAAGQANAFNLGVRIVHW